MVHYRADQVGSLLRPPELLQARQAYQAGNMDIAALRHVEDRAIAAAIDMQRQVGIEVYTDGEMRRDAWMSDVAEAVDGFIDDHHMLHWHTPDGSTEDEPSRAKVVAATLRQVRRLTAHEVAFLQQHAPGLCKITLPSPVSISQSGYKPGVSDTAYPTRAQFLADLVRIMQGEMQALVAEGVAYIQLDEGFTGYVGEDWRTRLQQRGIDPDRALADDIAAENACYDALPREQVTLAMHLCRGNSKSRWSRSGGYDWLAEQVFTALHVDRFLLEYDSERAGGFAPLRFVPKGKIVVLGLVSTKHGQLEQQDDLLRRIDEAAQYVPYEQLALSPQCGFASVAEGNLLSPDEQRRKLALVVETAQRVWG
jgi:5-methyltetrahydropteroyltriglutamate--homocysteine methyltransferase